MNENLPRIISCYIFSTDSNAPTRLEDANTAALDEAHRRAYKGAPLASVAERMVRDNQLQQSQPLSIPGIVGAYSFHCLQASPMDVIVFLCDESAVSEIQLDQEDPLQMLLPLMDAALLTFLATATVWECSTPDESPAVSRGRSKERRTRDRGSSQTRSRTPTTRQTAIVDASSAEEIFRILDIEGRGRLSLEEFATGCQHLGIDFTREEIARVFDLIISQGYRRGAILPSAPVQLTPTASATFESVGSPVIVSNQSMESASSPPTHLTCDRFVDFFNRQSHRRANSMKNVHSSPQKLQVLTLSPSKTSIPSDGSISEDEPEPDNAGQDMMRTTSLKLGIPNKMNMQILDRFRESIDKFLTLNLPPTNVTNFEGTLAHLANCDEVLQIMDNVLFHVPPELGHQRWKNRSLTHKVRLANFRTIINQRMAQHMKRMAAEHSSLMLEVRELRSKSPLPVGRETPTGTENEPQTWNSALTESSLKKLQQANRRGRGSLLELRNKRAGSAASRNSLGAFSENDDAKSMASSMVSSIHMEDMASVSSFHSQHSWSDISDRSYQRPLMSEQRDTAEVEHMSARIRDYKTEVKKLRNENTRAKKELSKMTRVYQTKIDKLNNKLKKRQGRDNSSAVVSDLRNTNKRLLKEKQKLQSDFDLLTKKYGKLEHAHQVMQDRTDGTNDLLNQLNRTRRESREYRSSRNSVRDANRRLTIIERKLRDKLEMLMRKFGDMHEGIRVQPDAPLEELVDALMSRLNTISTKFKNALKRLETIESRHADQIRQMEEQLETQRQSATAKLQNRGREVKRMQEKLTQVVEDMKHSSREMEQRLEGVDEPQDVVRAFLNAYGAARAQVSKLRERAQQMKEEKQQSEQQISAFKQRIADAENEMKEQHNQVTQLQQQNENLSSRLNDFGDQVLQLNLRQCNSVEDALGMAFSAIRKTVAKNEELANSLMEERLKIEANDDTMKANRVRIQELEATLGDERQLLSNLQSQVGEDTNAIDQLQEQVKMLRADAAQRDVELEDMTAVRERQAIELTKLQAEFEDCAARLEKEELAKASLQNEFDTLSTRTEKMQTDLTQELEESNRSISKLEEQNSAKDQALSQLQEEHHEAQLKITSQADDMERLQEELRRIQKTLRESEEEQNNLRSELEASRDALQEERTQKNDLLSKVRDLEEEREQLKAEHSEMVSDFENKVSNLESEIVSIKEEKDVAVQTLQEELKSTQEELTDTQKLKQGLEGDLEILRMENAEIEVEQNELRETIARLEGELESAQNEAFNTENRLEKRIDDLEKERQTTLHELHDLRTAKHDQAREISVQTTQIEEMGTKVEELEAIVNVPKEDKAVQTDGFESFEMMLRKRLEKQYADRFQNLTDENAHLLQELNRLVERWSKFDEDTTQPGPTSANTGAAVVMAVSPRELIVATGSDAQCVHLWEMDAETKTAEEFFPVARAPVDGDILSLAFSADGQYLAAGCALEGGPSGYVIVWGVQERSVFKDLRSRPTQRFGRVHSVGFSAVAGSTLILGGDTTGVVNVWELNTAEQVATIRGHGGVVNAISIIRTKLVSVAEDKTMQYFNLKHLAEEIEKVVSGAGSGQPSLSGRSSSLLSNSKRSKSLISKRTSRALPRGQSAASRNNLDSFDANQRIFRLNKLYEDTYPLYAVALSEDGRMAVCGSRRVRFFDLVLNTETRKLEAQTRTRLEDPDVNKCHCIHIRSAGVLISRLYSNRCAIFDVNSAELLNEKNYKHQIGTVGITCHGDSAVVCLLTSGGLRIIVWKFDPNAEPSDLGEDL